MKRRLQPFVPDEPRSFRIRALRVPASINAMKLQHVESLRPSANVNP